MKKLDLGKPVQLQVWRRVTEQVGEQVRWQVRLQVEDQVRWQVDDRQLRLWVWWQVWRRVRG